MMKQYSWLVLGALVMVGVSSGGVQAKPAVKKEKPAEVTASVAKEDEASEPGLDLTLRTTAAAMPVTTADGSAMESPASHMFLMDYETGQVLAEKAGDRKMYPSSMTKMMTLYIVFDRLKQGTLALDNSFTVSEKAWRMQGSKMFVPLGQQVGLEDLIRGISIQSGNDACVALAEGIAGSEEAFAKQMNDTAQKLGMKDTNFTDSSGWPNPNNTTTPKDLALLGAALVRDFPQYYHYLAEREFTYHGIRQFNRNLLLGNASLKVDGLKTGHTEAAGYGITLSATEGDRRLVLVINGLDSDAARAQEGERLLKWGFANFESKLVFKAGNPIIDAKVWMGAQRDVSLAVASDIKALLPKTGNASVQAFVNFKAPLIAPVKQGDEVGTLKLVYSSGLSQEFPLVAVADVTKLGFFARIPRALGL